MGYTWQHSLHEGDGSLYSESLRTARYGVRILVWAWFSATVQTGSGAHSASYTMVTEFLSRW